MLFLFYVVLAILKLADELPRNNPGLCVAAGIICQFVYLSAMFWLNSIRYRCIDNRACWDQIAVI